jgi:iron complex transport system substrate-binding protein
MRKLTAVLLVIIVALASATGYLGYRVATEPTSLETLTGLTWDEMATMSALAPVLAFSPEDVPGKVGNPDDPFIDDLGREVSISEHSPVERIVSLHPAATETIFYLGANDKLVGVSDAWLQWITSPEDVVQTIKSKVDAKGLTTLNAFSVEPRLF